MPVACNHDKPQRLVGEEVVRLFSRYFVTGEVMFRLREGRPLPRGAQPPTRFEAVGVASARAPMVPLGSMRHGASRAAVQSHYDVANKFYATWLGPTMLYRSGWWEPAR